ncbi:FAD:protein FMN transferase [Trinickia sp. Y13]|uniref:FAD:protein FMN transferase n=1 Tax=Trinickia sp. Y13 TaxID=2917807 RepID=UPI002406B9C1|nr:FAD:protein FMN transferase [Trinickia sp. Y13]MDG0024352.1 FAD:protein FMN transferase [Trinickia sp. Y13]
MAISRKIVLASVALVIAIGAGLWQTLRTPEVYVQGTYVFGTRVQLVLYGVPLREAQQDADAVFSHFQAMHRELHAWQPSEVTQLNRSIAAGVPFQASPELVPILRAARQLSIDSQGLFEPGLGRLIRLWGFQADQFGVKPPSQDAVQREAALRPRIAQLDISPSGIVTSTNRAVAVDLGGYAKGWSLDEAAAILRQRGVQNALIDVGGNLLALGTKGGAPWQVGIQDPRGPGTLATLALRDGEAIGTSGDYARFFKYDGVRYSHIIDPRNGFPATQSESVTVLVKPGPHAGALSDGASKAPFVAGPATAMSLARKVGVDALLLVDTSGHVWVSSSMAARVHFTNASLHPEQLD